MVGTVLFLLLVVLVEILLSLLFLLNRINVTHNYNQPNGKTIASRDPLHHLGGWVALTDAPDEGSTKTEHLGARAAHLSLWTTTRCMVSTRGRQGVVLQTRWEGHM